MGVASYLHLGREEDPSFTIKTMLIQVQWPGASVDEMSKQVTERIERKLEELETLDYTKSMTTNERVLARNERTATQANDVIARSTDRGSVADSELERLAGERRNSKFGRHGKPLAVSCSKSRATRSS